jgi:two-component system, LytTR family, sensor histidine kinase AgrC
MSSSTVQIQAFWALPFIFLLIYIPQGYMLYAFLNRFLVLRRRKVSLLAGLVGFYIGKSAGLAHLTLAQSVLLHLAAYTLVAFFYFGGSPWQKLFFGSFYTVFTSVVELLVRYLAQLAGLPVPAQDASTSVWLTITPILMVLVSTMALVLLLFLLRVESPFNLSPNEWSILTIVPASSLFLILISMQVRAASTSRDDFVITGGFAGFLLGLLVINVAVMLMYHMLMRRIHVEFQNHLLERQIMEYTKRLEDGRSMARMHHDRKHFLMGLSALLDQNAVQEAQQVISAAVREHRGPTASTVHTGHAAIDGICNEKAALAEASGIGFRHRLQIPADLALAGREVELALILGNALDNAIEGALRLGDQDKRWVALEAVYHEDQLVLSVKNPSLPVTRDAAGFLISSKRSWGQRGLGVESIERAAHKLGGSVTCRFHEGLFTLIAVLPV